MVSVGDGEQISCVSRAGGGRPAEPNLEETAEHTETGTKRLQHKANEH